MPSNPFGSLDSLMTMLFSPVKGSPLFVISTRCTGRNSCKVPPRRKARPLSPLESFFKTYPQREVPCFSGSSFANYGPLSPGKEFLKEDPPKSLFLNEHILFKPFLGDPRIIVVAFGSFPPDKVDDRQPSFRRTAGAGSRLKGVSYRVSPLPEEGGFLPARTGFLEEKNWDPEGSAQRIYCSTRSESSP